MSKYDAVKLNTFAIVHAFGQTRMHMWLEHEEPTTFGADVEWRWRLVFACVGAIALGLVLLATGYSTAAGAPFIVATVASMASCSCDEFRTVADHARAIAGAFERCLESVSHEGGVVHNDETLGGQYCRRGNH